MNVLLIEDDPYIAELIKLYCEKNSFTIDIAYDGDHGLEKFYKSPADLVILDIMLPKMSGWDVCKLLRIDYQTPIIMLTAKGETYDKLKGFKLGADDYLVKPFEPEELIARMNAVLKRTNPELTESQLVEYPHLSINKNEFVVLVNGEKVDMPLKETMLLYYLASHPNQVFTRQQLLAEIWGFDFDGDPRTVDVHIMRIREKIKESSSWLLKTIRGVGYKFEVDLSD